MPRNVNVALDTSDFEYVERVKEDLDLTWEEFLTEAAECLEEREDESG